MLCPNCKFEVLEGQKFCGECGTLLPQERNCPSCGAKVVLSSKFCGMCGCDLNADSLYSTSMFVDSRDGEHYKIVKIGNQEWFAENFRYKGEDSRVFAENELNVQTFGRLYTWDAAVKYAPEGWHLPSKDEFEELENFISLKSKRSAGKVLKSRDSLIWKEGAGTDEFGFNGISAGYYDTENGFQNDGDLADFWTSSEDSSFTAVDVNLDGDKDDIRYSEKCDKENACSVRYIKNTVRYDRKLKEFMAKFGTFTDSRDGEVYKTVKIGDQEWFAENLRYRSPQSKKNKANNKACGRIYTWDEAVENAPEGWHLPSKEEFEQLETFVEDHSENSVADALKSKVDWCEKGCDEFGFRILPLENDVAQFWCSTDKDENDDGCIYGMSIVFDEFRIDEELDSDDYRSIRYIKNSAEYDKKQLALAEKQKALQARFSSFTDPRDGEVYRTVRIGDQEWFAENLRYRSPQSKKNQENNEACGRAYTLEDAMTVAPEGWHLPTKEEFEQLEAFVDDHSDNSVADALKSKKDWFENGNDEFGFCIVPTDDDYAFFWTSGGTDEDGFEDIFGVDVYYDIFEIHPLFDKEEYRSVRLIRNAIDSEN